MRLPRLSVSLSVSKITQQEGQLLLGRPTVRCYF